MNLDDRLFPPEPPTTQRSATRRASTPASERRLIMLVALSSGLGAAWSGGEPAGLAAADMLLLGAFGVCVTLAGSRARRASWLWASGVAVVSSTTVVLAAVAASAMCLAIAAHLLDRRERVEGALIAGVSVQVLLRLGDVGFFGAAGLLVIVALAPMAVSAYRVSPRRVTRRVRWVALGGALSVVVGIGGFAAASVLAWGDLESGLQSARDGLDAARKGDDENAARLLSQAADRLERAERLLGSWWAAPARAVPLVGHHARAASVATGEGRRLLALAATAAQQVPVSELRFEDGRLDLDLVRRAEAPLVGIHEALQRADRRLAEVDTRWLVAPFDGRLRELRGEVEAAEPEARTAAEVVAIAPELLGGEGVRRYFVIFTTPAESRGLGGFMGNWAELTAQDGRLTLSRSGRTQELNDASPRSERTISSVVDGSPDTRIVEYLDRYRIYRPWEAIQDVTLSPDFPTVAEVMRQLYPQVGGEPIDGVMMVDPFALAGLMRFTGPIEIEGLRRPLTHRNAAQFLLVDQYEQFPGSDGRADLLEEVSRLTFERLTTGDLPSPQDVAERMSPLVRGGRLLFTAFAPDEAAVFDALGLAGAMPAPSGRDALSVVTQNSSQNKIDVYLERSIDYDVTIDPSTGALRATVTVELVNSPPDGDLPNAVSGSNDQGLPPATNEVYVNLYTPHLLASATVDGERLPMGNGRELGYWVYSTEIQIPRGATRTVVFELNGSVPAGEAYELVYAGQPLVNADRVTVHVEAEGGWSLHPPEGADPDEGDFDEVGTGAEAGFEGPTDRLLSLEIEAPPDS